MRGNFLGIYTPGHSIYHRLSVGWLYLVMLAIALPPLIAQNAIVTITFLVLATLVLLHARLGWKILRIPWQMCLMLAVLAGYQFAVGKVEAGVVVAGNIIVALYASRLLMSTTPGSELLDGLARFLQPLRHLGIDPEKISLAVGLMLRSIPYLIGCLTDVRDSVHARGHRRSVAWFMTPVVIRGVRFALVTGEALAARGLPESPDDESR